MAVNGLHVVLGESDAVVALLKKARRHWHLQNSGAAALEDTDPLLRSFADLRDVLNKVSDVMDMNPLTFLSPFLEVIRSQNTNGPITESALSSVAKFLSYGLIDASSVKAAHTVESIAQAVTHTKFIGGANAGSDECVLFEILHVLRALLLSPAGRLLSNEAVCDMMQSCFRICFELHLSELLRKAARTTLADMTQLIFTRLPTFEEDLRHPYIRKLVMNTKGQRRRRKTRPSEKKTKKEVKEEDEEERERERSDSEKEAEDVEVVESPKETDVLVEGSTASSAEGMEEEPAKKEEEKKKDDDIKTITSDSEGEGAAVGGVDLAAGLCRGGGASGSESSERVNALLLPYGLPCCRELLRFLIALTDPLDRQNTEQMIVLGLSLLTVALEAAADHLSSYVLLLPLIKNELCRSLLQLLDTEKLPIFAAASRCCFLLMESMRAQLKFQLEALFGKLKGIVLSEQSRISYEQKEMALESIVQLWRIPGLVTELYLNFDCDLYAGNVFEDMTKLLAENAFPVSGLRSTSLLSLDALLVVIDTIDMNCHCRRAGAIVESTDEQSRALAAPALSGYDIGKRIVGGEHAVVPDVASEKMQQLQHSSPALRVNRHAPSPSLPQLSEVIERKKRKKLLNEATDIFNKNPKKGIDFLREKGLMEGASSPAATASTVEWLRANPRLDKAMIADYICNRKHADVLEAFVKAFPFENTRLDVALRLFLETFRLPGEAPLISMVMQHFSEAWFKANDEPFNHVDAAFTLSYAVIMLNTDQHNPTARRNQPSMTVECFKRNLSGTNGGKDFEPEMLEQVYHAIRTEEIVMPAEQIGLVKENYLWKVLLRRGETNEGCFTHAPTGWNDQDLFALIWGPAIAALSYVFDKSEHEHILQRALSGYRQCASIAADYGMSDVFDNLAIHLCKFSTLMTAAERAGDDSVELQRQRAIAAAASNNEGVAANAPEMIACAFGENTKAHMATRTMFELVLAHGDILREGWKNVLDCLLHLFTSRLLPTEFTECEDFVDEKGWVSIVRVHSKSLSPSRSEGGLLSWFGIGGAADAAAARQLTPEQERLVKIATTVVNECRPWQLIVDSKYLTSSALNELLNALTNASGSVVAKADAEAEQRGHRAAKLSEEDEDSVIFYLELIVAICIENKDRLGNVWQLVRRHMEWLLSPRFGRSHVVVERAAVGLLRVANRYLYRENDPLADEVLQSLGILLDKLSLQQLPAAASYVLSRQISYGLHELLRRNAANVHRKEQWSVIFALLQAAGAALTSDDVEDAREAREQAGTGGERNAYSDTERGGSIRTTGADRGYTSDDPASNRNFGSASSLSSTSTTRDSAISLQKAPSQEWTHLSHKDAASATAEALRALGGSAAAYARNETLVLRTALGRHEPAAYLKVAETLEFLFRDAAHITPENVDSAVECLLTMVEAGLNGGEKAAGPLSGRAQQSLRSNVADGGEQRRVKQGRGGKKELSTEVEREVEKAKNEEKELSFRYEQVSYQLMTACQTIFKRTPAMYREWAESGHGDAATSSIPSLWGRVWSPLLRAISRSCADCRKNVRDRAADLLDRTFLLSELNEGLGAAEWESCFEQVLFPLLSQLLTNFSPMDPFGVEQTRTRVLKTVVRITLNHRGLLTEQCAFLPLWLRLLSFMERYANERSGQDSLGDTVQETLKNMLFVLHSEGKFASIAGLYDMTVARLQPVFPALAEVLPAQQPPPTAAAAPTVAATVPPAVPTSLVGLAEPPRRVLVAPAVDEEEKVDGTPASSPSSPLSPSRSAPIEIPELTEVVVHSGAASPLSGTSPPPSVFEHQPPAAPVVAAALAAVAAEPAEAAPPTAPQPEQVVQMPPVDAEAAAAHAAAWQAYYAQQAQYQYHQQMAAAAAAAAAAAQQQQHSQPSSSFENSPIHHAAAMQSNPLQHYPYYNVQQMQHQHVQQSPAAAAPMPTVHSVTNPMPIYSTTSSSGNEQLQQQQHYQHPVHPAAANVLATSPNSAFSYVGEPRPQQPPHQHTHEGP